MYILIEGKYYENMESSDRKFDKNDELPLDAKNDSFISINNLPTNEYSETRTKNITISKELTEVLSRKHTNSALQSVFGKPEMFSIDSSRINVEDILAKQDPPPILKEINNNQRARYWSAVSEERFPAERHSFTIIHDDFEPNPNIVRYYQEDGEEIDEPEPIVQVDNFKDLKQKRRFIIIVLSLFASGIAIALFFVCLMNFIPEFAEFLRGQASRPLYIINIFFIIGITLFYFCFPAIMMKGACSYICFIAFVYSEVMMSCVLARAIQPTTLITGYCLLLSALIAAILLITFVHVDFNASYWIVTLGAISLIMSGILGTILAFVLHVPVIRTVLIVVVITTLFVAFLMDFQAVLRGRNESLKDHMYFYGALTLYMNAVTVYQYLLMLLGYFDHK